MLFTSTAATTIGQMFQRASAQASRARKEEAAKRLDYYHDAQLDHLRALLAKKFAEPGKLTPCFVNIVRKVINSLSMVYLEPPKREVEGSEHDLEVFKEIARTTGLDGKMKLASRYTKLLKTIMVRLVWRGGCLDLDILTPNILDVEVGDSPEDVRSVMVTHYDSTSRVEEVTYSVWTAEEWRKLNYRGQVTSREPNPYQRIPFLPIWDSLPMDSFWLEGGGDLVTLQEAINLKLTDLLYVLQMQGFGVGFVTGQRQEPGAPVSLAVGPGAMLQLPQDGKVGFASTNAPIEEVVEAIDKLLKWAAVSNGLPASSLATEPTEESGLSKLVSNRELDELRRDDVGLFRRYETQLFDLMRVVWNVHNPTRRISDKAKFTVDFYDPKPVTSASEQVDTWERLEGLGVITAVDIALEHNPDLKTREDALAHLLQLQDERAALQESNL